MILTINQAGQIEAIASDELAGLELPGLVTKRRASHVLPCGWLKRQAFKLLRWATGEVGPVSDWTRGWRGPWQVQIVNGPSLGIYAERADAIAAEVAWIEAHQL